MPRPAFEGLEPYDGNLSRTVLRGLGARNGPRLPGVWKSTNFDAGLYDIKGFLWALIISMDHR